MSMFAKHLYASRNVDEENPYWLSFSDIMSGLLIIFILASLYLMIELRERTDKIDESVIELQKADQIRSEMLNEIKDDLSKKGIQVEIADNATVLRIPPKQLHFLQSLYEIPDSEKVTVNLIGETLYQSIEKDDRKKFIDTIFIEGHTDGKPAGRNIAGGNWGLSTFRAISVWDAWRLNPEYGPKLNQLTNIRGVPIFSVSGYADTRRAVVEERDENDEKMNRRIDIRFTMKQPDLKSISDLKEQAR